MSARRYVFATFTAARQHELDGILGHCDRFVLIVPGCHNLRQGRHVHEKATLVAWARE